MQKVHIAKTYNYYIDYNVIPSHRYVHVINKT